jgi:hypothetical protein
MLTIQPKSSIFQHKQLTINIYSTKALSEVHDEGPTSQILVSTYGNYGSTGEIGIFGWNV